MQKIDLLYPSSSGEHDIKCRIWKPDEGGGYKAVVQIAHGMSEHIGRYDDFAGFLASHRCVVCANDHKGHGDSFNGTYGYMGQKDGYLHMVKDMRGLYSLVKPQYSNLPYILLGHSMGSFLARNYCGLYGDSLNGIIYSGTGSVPFGLNLAVFLCKALVKCKGGRTAGKLFSGFLGKTNGKRFQPMRTPSDWLSSDEEIVDAFIADEKAGFPFTYAGYLDLLMLIKTTETRRWVKSVPKELPTYIFSGKDDPIGAYGKGVTAFFNKLIQAGCTDVTLKLYEKGRHEMLNEKTRQEVYQDLLQWIDRVAAKV